jgi:hypothetical protein
MSQKLDFQVLQTLYTDARFEAVVLSLDRLHDAVIEGRTPDVSTLEKQALIGWLREIAFVTQETIHELEAGAEPRIEERQVQEARQEDKPADRSAQIGRKLIVLEGLERKTAHVFTKQSSGSVGQ